MISPRLQELSDAIQNRGPDAVREFWSEIERQGAPILEPGPDDTTWVTFLWRDDGLTGSVAVIQDWGADGIREHLMVRIPGSDVWYFTRSMRSDTRTTYQLSPSPSSNPSEPAPYQTDPLNPRTYAVSLSETAPDIQFSLLELPDAPALPWRQTPSFPAGTVQLYTPFADQRRLWVYLPPIRDEVALPVLVVLDGRLYKDMLRLPALLDTLIGSGQIPPVAAILVDNPDRGELCCDPRFSSYMAKEVLPWLRSSFPVTADPLQTVALGSSLGGLAAVFLAFQHPAVFGAVLSLGGWFRWRPDGDPTHHWLARQMAAAPRAPVYFWIQVGNLETARMLDGGPTQLAANQFLRDTLQARGYAVSYREYSGGHDFSSLESPIAETITEILKTFGVGGLSAHDFE